MLNRFLAGILASGVIALLSLGADASPPPDGRAERIVCDDAAAIAARDIGAPLDYLRALTRTETGRARGGRLTPWPWTVNMEGEGRWFETREQALAFVRARHAAGARSFDIGCFQINYRWHGDAFANFEEMFDPVTNARYAATFLTELRRDGEEWRRAVGRFHSKTPALAKRYRARFDRILAGLDPAPAAMTPSRTALFRRPRRPAAAPVLARTPRREETAALSFLIPPGGATPLLPAAASSQAASSSLFPAAGARPLLRRAAPLLK